MPLRRCLLGALACLAVLAPAARADLSLVDDTEPIGPGITLRHHEFLEPSGWTDAQVLEVDLANRAVSTDLLTAGPAVNDRGPVSEMADKAGAVAATNGDFFDIDGAGGPLGAEVKTGTLLKSAGFAPHFHVGVGSDGVGRMIDATLQASATFAGAPHAVDTVNTPSADVPADALIAFTPAWGDYTRTRGMQGVPTAELAEAVVVDGKVASVAQAGAGDGAIPDGAFTLVGRGASADALRALKPGDPVSLSYALKDDVARRMRFAIGGNYALVAGGAVQPIADTSLAPRTAIGFKDGGRTMILLTTDGRQTQVVGNTLTEIAQMMASLGAQDAMNLDGGGSTTMVARGLGAGAVSVRNTPSDGAERNDPNGVGVFVAPGSRTPSQLIVGPEQPKVFPGLHRTLSAAAVDDHQTPVAAGDVRWSSDAGSVSGGLLAAPDAPGASVRVTAQDDSATGEATVRVLGALDHLESSSARLAITDTSTPATLAITGRDAQGYAAPVELADLTLDYDRSLVRVSPDGDALTLTPLKAGATLMTIAAGGQRIQVPVTVGVATKVVHRFDDADEVSHWTTNGTAPSEQRLSLDGGQLRLDYTARRNQGITWKDPASYIALPGQPLRVRIRLRSSVPAEYASLYWLDTDGVAHNKLQSPIAAGENAIEWTLPADTKFPIRFTQFQTIETDAAKQQAGSVVFESLEVDNAPDVQAPDTVAPRADPLVSPDGTLPRGGWSFATLSDVQFTAAAPELAKVAVASLKRIREGRPDLVVLNGDVTDSGTTADVKLARSTLEAGGCDLIAVGAEPAPGSTPDPAGGKVPCYYVPGNHESYGAGNVQGDLKPWIDEFGRPYRTFDHKGTRFVLLDSALGTLRGSAFDQLPMLASALDSARSDPSIHDVLVFAHHPVDDPSQTKSSQLGDRLEVGLVEKLLTDFRARSGKAAAMVGSHAQVMDVHRIEGVPYTVLPSSGKAPYGTPDRGGFTGYLRWQVDASRGPGQQWLTADVRAFAQSVSLSAPASLEVSRSAPLSGSIVQPDGVTQDGTRVVPLAYPMSVHWSGAGLAVGGDADAARRAGKVALLDPVTRTLTGLRPGTVSVTVTNESMRSDTTAPVSTTRTVRVVPYSGPGPRFVAASPVFPAQPVGTVGPAQAVTVVNGGDRPLVIGAVRLRAADAGSAGEFLLASDDACAGTTLAPGARCTVLVRYAPARAGATSRAALTFATNTAQGADEVALSATSTGAPVPADGQDGAPSPPAPPAPKGDPGSSGSPGAAGLAGPSAPPNATATARPKVTASCRLVARRRAVRCTIRTESKYRLRATVRVAGRSRTVTRRGTVTMTVAAKRRLTTRTHVAVTAVVAGRTSRLSARPRS